MVLVDLQRFCHAAKLVVLRSHIPLKGSRQALHLRQILHGHIKLGHQALVCLFLFKQPIMHLTLFLLFTIYLVKDCVYVLLDLA